MKRIDMLKQQLDTRGIPCRAEATVAPYTTFRIGGRVALLIEPTSEQQLITALRLTHRSGVRTLMLGRGSNVLFADEDMLVAVIRTTELRAVRVDGLSVTAACGATLNEIALCAQRAALGGLEFAYGIPGTLGGALCMNAGAFGGEMSDVVTSVRVFDMEHDAVLSLGREQLDFSYRHSLLLAAPHLVALGAGMALYADSADEIAARMQENMQRRRDKQPLEYPSAGSVFKRPEGAFAGALIEQSGLKGYRIGDAMVSPKHAGFIVNVGHATAHDVLLLIEHIRKTVMHDHGVMLEPEVQILTALGAR